MLSNRQNSFFKFLLFVLCTLLLVDGEVVFGQMTGKNFVVAWPPVSDVQKSSANNISMGVIIISSESGQVQFEGGTWISLGEGLNFFEINPSNRRIYYVGHTGSSGIDGTSNTVYTNTNGVYNITTTVDVSVYAYSNYNNPSGHDGTFPAIVSLLPVEKLDTSYIFQTYPGTTSYSYPVLTIVPTANENTKVTLTLPNDVQIFHTTEKSINLDLSPNSAYYTRPSTGYSSLNGIRIKSDKPIAVFQSNNVGVPNGSQYEDLLWEQAYPVSTFGKEYVVVRASQTEDRVLITALRDGTEVTIQPSTNYSSPMKYTLSAYQTQEYTLTDGACHISSNKAIACYRYTTAGQRNGWIGDPSVSIIPPLTQMTKSSSIAFFRDTRFSNILDKGKCFVTLVVPASDRNSMLWHGTALNASEFTPIYGLPEYYFLRKEVTSGSQLTFSNAGGFLGWVSGFTNDGTALATGGHGGFTYLMGANIKDETSLVVDDNGDIVPGKTPKHYYDTACNVFTFNGESYYSDTTFRYDSEDDGIQYRHVKIWPSYNMSPIEDSICNGEARKWRGSVYSKPGEYYKVYESSHHRCDSVYTYILKKKSTCPDDGSNDDTSDTNFKCSGVDSYRELRKAKANNKDNKSLIKENTL